MTADHRRLMQVLDNLIANAVKFSHRNRRVLVTACYAGGQWRIDVTDTGIGIPPEEAGQLFSRFVRASNARTAGLPRYRPGLLHRQGAHRDARRARGGGQHAGRRQHVQRLPAGGRMMKGRVLVIEDDQDISLGIRTVLGRQGLEVDSSSDGKQGLRVFHVSPRPRGTRHRAADAGRVAVLERIRDLSDVPVLILTAHGNEADKVRGLHGGADDYLTKPFGNRELTARVEALLRRPRTEQPQAEVYDDGRLLVRLTVREVSVRGAPVTLTPTEFRLLAALIRHPGQTLTAEQLLKLAWNDPLGVGPERVKFGVMRLRRKLGPDAGEPGAFIEAVRGFGYRPCPGVIRYCPAPEPQRGDQPGRGYRRMGITKSATGGVTRPILVVKDDPKRPVRRARAGRPGPVRGHPHRRPGRGAAAGRRRALGLARHRPGHARHDRPGAARRAAAAGARAAGRGGERARPGRVGGRAARARGQVPGEAAAGGPAHRDGDRPDRPGTALIRITAR